MTKPSLTILSNDVEIMGDIVSKSDMQIDCHHIGNVHANVLTLGEEAHIEGNIFADELIIKGRVIGRITASKVCLISTSVVNGDIEHASISIEEGARYEGFVQLKTPASNKIQS